MKRCLLHEKKSMRKETCWILSNLAAGTKMQVDEIIKNDFLPILVNIISGDDFEVIFYKIINLDSKRSCLGCM